MNQKKSTYFMDNQVLSDMKTFLFACMFSMAIVPVFADDTGIFAAAAGASTSVISELITLYNGVICPAVFVCSWIGVAIFGTNEKMTSVLKQVAKWCLIIYIGLNCLSLIFKTLDWVISLLNG